jgi:hypothetical protein
MTISPSSALKLFPVACRLHCPCRLRKTPEISSGAASIWLLFRSLNRSQSRISAGYEISLADNLLRTAKTASHRLRGLSLFAGSKCLINGGQSQSSFIGQLRATSAWTAFEISVLRSHLRPNNANTSVANTTRSGWSVGSRRAPAGRRRRGSRARGPGWFRCGCGFRFAAMRGRRPGGIPCNRRDRPICSAAG